MAHRIASIAHTFESSLEPEPSTQPIEVLPAHNIYSSLFELAHNDPSIKLKLEIMRVNEETPWRSGELTEQEKQFLKAHLSTIKELLGLDINSLKEYAANTEIVNKSLRLYLLNPEVKEIIRKGNYFHTLYGDPLFKSLITAAASLSKSLNYIPLLLRAGNDPNQRDRFGNTALHWAVANANPDCALELLKSEKMNCDIACWGFTQMIPLELAVNKGRRNEDWDGLVNELIKNTKDVNHQDADGNSALHWAYLRREAGWGQALLKKGALEFLKK